MHELVQELNKRVSARHGIFRPVTDEGDHDHRRTRRAHVKKEPLSAPISSKEQQLGPGRLNFISRIRLHEFFNRIQREVVLPDQTLPSVGCEQEAPVILNKSKPRCFLGSANRTLFRGCPERPEMF